MCSRVAAHELIEWQILDCRLVGAAGSAVGCQLVWFVKGVKTGIGLGQKGNNSRTL